MHLLTAKSKGASMKYQQLIQEQRYQISAYLKIGMTQTDIAKELNVHKSAVCRELKRNRGRRGYRPQQAHRAGCASDIKTSRNVELTRLFSLASSLYSTKNGVPNKFPTASNSKNFQLPVTKAFTGISTVINKRAVISIFI
jgi:IS30 family transposase